MPHSMVKCERSGYKEAATKKQLTNHSKQPIGYYRQLLNMSNTTNITKNWQWQPLVTEELPHIKPEDTCFCLGDHYEYNPANKRHHLSDTITNFKRAKKYRTSSAWPWRNRDVGIFADHVAKFAALKDQEPNTAIMAIPSSKKPDHPEYDSRFEDLFHKLFKKFGRHIQLVTPIAIKESTPAAPLGGEKQPQDLLDNYSWQGEDLTSIENILICDDLITTGAHFRAVSDFLRKNNYNNKITGLLFAHHG